MERERLFELKRQVDNAIRQERHARDWEIKRELVDEIDSELAVKMWETSNELTALDEEEEQLKSTLMGYLSSLSGKLAAEIQKSNHGQPGEWKHTLGLGKQKVDSFE